MISKELSATSAATTVAGGRALRGLVLFQPPTLFLLSGRAARDIRDEFAGLISRFVWVLVFTSP